MPQTTFTFKVSLDSPIVANTETRRADTGLQPEDEVIWGSYTGQTVEDEVLVYSVKSFGNINIYDDSLRSLVAVVAMDYL